MGRSWLRVLCLLGGFSAAGCTDYGTYNVSWQFVVSAPPPAVAGAGADCGFHGVDSIRVIGSSTEGDHEDFTALCPPGKLSHGVPVGTWTFAVHQIDVRGVVIDPKDAAGDPMAPMAGAVIAKGATADLDPVMLISRPVCDDGVDNDGDGRVDADDPACIADPSSATE
jgi:hypothetical protein